MVNKMSFEAFNTKLEIQSFRIVAAINQKHKLKCFSVRIGFCFFFVFLNPELFKAQIVIDRTI